MRKIGRHPKTTSARVRPDLERLEIDCSHIGGQSSPDLPADRVLSHPFSGRQSSRTLQVRALAEAMSWFMDRGYPVSLPVEPVPYDLIAESDQGLQRVQVKSSQTAGSSGRYEVKLHRSRYVRAQGGRPGHYLQAPYRPDDVDIFFIVCDDGARYLVPYPAVAGLSRIVITAKYAMYRI